MRYSDQTLWGSVASSHRLSAGEHQGALTLPGLVRRFLEADRNLPPFAQHQVRPCFTSG